MVSISTPNPPCLDANHALDPLSVTAMDKGDANVNSLSLGQTNFFNGGVSNSKEQLTPNGLFGNILSTTNNLNERLDPMVNEENTWENLKCNTTEVYVPKVTCTTNSTVSPTSDGYDYNASGNDGSEEGEINTSDDNLDSPISACLAKKYLVDNLVDPISTKNKKKGNKNSKSKGKNVSSRATRSRTKAFVSL